MSWVWFKHNLFFVGTDKRGLAPFALAWRLFMYKETTVYISQRGKHIRKNKITVSTATNTLSLKFTVSICNALQFQNKTSFAEMEDYKKSTPEYLQQFLSHFFYVSTFIMD